MQRYHFLRLEHSLSLNNFLELAQILKESKFKLEEKFESNFIFGPIPMPFLHPEAVRKSEKRERKTSRLACYLITNRQKFLGE